MNKYFITCDNHLFCGMYTNYVALAKSENEFENMLELWAYENFCELGGFDNYDEDCDDNEHSLEELDESYFTRVEEFDEELHGEFDSFELIYKGDI